MRPIMRQTRTGRRTTIASIAPARLVAPPTLPLRQRPSMAKVGDIWTGPHPLRVSAVNSDRYQTVSVRLRPYA